MAWIDTTQRHADGRTFWRCSACAAVVWHAAEPRPCTCSADPPRPTSTSLPCPHRGLVHGSVDCGCGSSGARLPVYQCALFGLCTVAAPGSPVRVDGRKPAVCLGCDARPT